MTTIRRSARLLTKATQGKVIPKDEKTSLKKTIQKTRKAKTQSAVIEKVKVEKAGIEKPLKVVPNFSIVVKSILIPTEVLVQNSDYILLAENIENGLLHLSSADPKLTPLINSLPIDPKDYFSRRTCSTSFQSLMRSIISQQISNKAAFSIFSKFLATFGKPISLEEKSQNIGGYRVEKTFHDSPPDSEPEISFLRFPYPHEVLEIDNDALRSVGISTRKTEYMKSLAEYYDKNKIDDEILKKMSDEEMIETLTKVKGIGKV
ncbi:hypothetical protein BB560_000914 [Smittium megazygosporum]|uniref:HhH-GPD domain-containing protein n=1 Tax=Smittium megazygosporum TaxID=133381 RepID=A0A2T9ZJ50_9FUNG|nr:hypothetical protein BB560_000914 [Smittium megazygosporum]